MGAMGAHPSEESDGEAYGREMYALGEEELAEEDEDENSPSTSYERSRMTWREAAKGELSRSRAWLSGQLTRRMHGMGVPRVYVS